jgi:hypothetical protein
MPNRAIALLQPSRYQQVRTSSSTVNTLQLDRWLAVDIASTRGHGSTAGPTVAKPCPTHAPISKPAPIIPAAQSPPAIRHPPSAPAQKRGKHELCPSRLLVRGVARQIRQAQSLACWLAGWQAGWLPAACLAPTGPVARLARTSSPNPPCSKISVWKPASVLRILPAPCRVSECAPV